MLQAGAGGVVAILLGPRLYRADPDIFGPVHILLVVAVLVIAPLALALAASPGPDGEHPLVHRAAIVVLPFAGVAATASFLFPAGRTAALVAAPWALFALLAAAFGLVRFYRRKGARFRLGDLCIDVGLVYLPVGARWLLLSRAGIEPPRVPEPIVVLTAVHFHYTFFTATLLTGLLGKRIAAAGSVLARRVFTLAALGVLAGPALVATGINTAVPLVEVAGAVLLAVSLATSAVLTVAVAARRTVGARAEWLLSIGSLAVGGGMVAAIVFGVGKYCSIPTLEIPEMIRLHGLANALYAVSCLLGWHAARSVAPASAGPTVAREVDSH